VSLIGPTNPLILVYYNDKGKFRMEPNAIATLQHVKGHLSVIYVYSHECQGKRFILNKVCGENIAWTIFVCLLAKK